MTLTALFHKMFMLRLFINIITQRIAKASHSFTVGTAKVKYTTWVHTRRILGIFLSDCGLRRSFLMGKYFNPLAIKVNDISQKES